MSEEPHPESREALILKIGNIIDSAWKGKNAKLEEWLRDERTAHLGQIRVEEAEFSGITTLEEEPWYGEVAMFHSTKTNNPFHVNKRLAPKLKPGELVDLTILGCCNLLAVTPKGKPNKERSRSKKLNGNSKKGNKKASRRRKKVARYS